MELFNIIASTCSIVSLFISLLIASKVLKISRANNDNQGEILCGDGTQTIVKDKAVFAENNSNATFNDYSGATINGEIDELPVLSEDKYPFIIRNAVKYNTGVASDTCDLMILDNLNTMCFTINFSSVISKPEDSRWIGYSIKSLPMKDWRSFVNDNYCLEFTHMAAGTINKIWIELTNKHTNQKIYQSIVKLEKNKNRFILEFSNFKNIVDDWKYVDEICFVFFPQECIGTQGTIFISDLSIKKH